MRSKTETLRALWQAWSRGSAEEILPLLHPDVVWDSAVLEREYRGHADVAAWLESLGREWKSLTVTLDGVEDAGGDVAVAHGRAIGFDYGGGKRFDTPLTCVAEFAGELVVRGRIFTDDADARRYLASRRDG